MAVTLVSGNEWLLPNSARTGRPVTGIVLHWTASSNLKGALSWMSKARQGSYHYLVDLDGTVTFTVDRARAAWHTGTDGVGRKNWCPDGRGIVNDVSIGISVVCPGNGKQKMTAAQKVAVVELVALLIERERSLKWITTHHECCPRSRPTELRPDLAGWDWSHQDYAGKLDGTTKTLTIAKRPAGV